MKWRKKALEVTADIADTSGYITTLEGVSEFKPGDYIVTGVDNEQWVVKPKWFKGAYEHIRDNQYKRMPQVVDAEPISETEVVHAPTGDIRGDKGDYKITGTKGEQWFCKPDIFLKTYEKIGGKAMEKNGLQKSIDQMGEDAVTRYLPKGMRIQHCDVHGSFLAHYLTKNPMCPLCALPTGDGNGLTATQVEHYINLRDNPAMLVFTNVPQV